VIAASEIAAAETGLMVGPITYAQTDYRETFSRGGRDILSNNTGITINTVTDLAEAIKAGSVKLADVLVGAVKISGVTYILNTRTAVALERAGIPKDQFKFYVEYIDVKDDLEVMQRLRSQLERNQVTPGEIITAPKSRAATRLRLALIQVSGRRTCMEKVIELPGDLAGYGDFWTNYDGLNAQLSFEYYEGDEERVGELTFKTCLFFSLNGLLDSYKHTNYDIVFRVEQNLGPQESLSRFVVTLSGSDFQIIAVCETVVFRTKQSLEADRPV
jgi:hypothetical protein